MTASWGSPYPQSDGAPHQHHHRRLSLSSEPSEDFPFHHLEINTPFLRPAPYLPESHDDRQPASLVSAAVLANRARRPARGLTEDWIRQHTAGDLGSEAPHWLSDAGDSENSSLSGSLSGGDEPGWLEEKDLRTPRAAQSGPGSYSLRAPRRHPRKRSSIETLKQADINRLNRRPRTMASPEPDKVVPDGASEHTLADSIPESVPTPSTPKGSIRSGRNGSVGGGPKVEFNVPKTPPSRSPKKKEPPMTPRLKKKVPWKGKNIMILLPRDDDRGKPGKAPKPLPQATVDNMLREWVNLGYGIDGFDLDDKPKYTDLETSSMSRGMWPDQDDLARERREQKYPVLLPDLNGKHSSLLLLLLLLPPI